MTRRKPETFGQRVRELRVRQGMTQGQLARKIKIRRPYLSLIESDQAWETRVRQMVAMADALGVSTDDLLLDSPVRK